MVKKKIEKVWLFGQTRDYDDSNYEETLAKDIEAYFNGKLDGPIPVRVYHIDNYLSINIGLDCGFVCKDDTIPQSLAGILFGINNDFLPEYCFDHCPDFGGCLDVRTRKDDFIENYKKNVRHYGATTVKNVEFCSPDYGGFIVRLIY